jgi:hypothetical protein
MDLLKVTIVVTRSIGRLTMHTADRVRLQG